MKVCVNPTPCGGREDGGISSLFRHSPSIVNRTQLSLPLAFWLPHIEGWSLGWARSVALFHSLCGRCYVMSQCFRTWFIRLHMLSPSVYSLKLQLNLNSFVALHSDGNMCRNSIHGKRSEIQFLG